VTSAVVIAAAVVAALNALAGLFGGWSWHRHEPRQGFWPLLRIAQLGAVVFAAFVGMLAAAGHQASAGLFYLYALLPLAVAFVAEQLRAVSAQAVLDRRELADAQAVGRLPESDQRAVVEEIVRREMGVMAASALVVVFLAWRAAETAHGL
jgi:hypothetical protein